MAASFLLVAGLQQLRELSRLSRIAPSHAARITVGFAALSRSTFCRRGRLPPSWEAASFLFQKKKRGLGGSSSVLAGPAADAAVAGNLQHAFAGAQLRDALFERGIDPRPTELLAMRYGALEASLDALADHPAFELSPTPLFDPNDRQF